MKPILARVALTIGMAVAAAPAHADIIVQTSGSTDPTTLGFTNNDGGYPVYGSAGADSWDISGSYCCTYDQYALDDSQLSELQTAPTWTYTATYSNLSAGTSTTAGSYADLIVNGIRFDLGLSSDGLGDQILNIGQYGQAPYYTIFGLGANPVTLSFIYNNTSNTGDAYVNGVEVISDYGGSPEQCCGDGIVFFGGVDGDFYNVELQTGSSASPTPEPSTSMLAIAAGLCFAVAVYRGHGQAGIRKEVGR